MIDSGSLRLDRLYQLPEDRPALMGIVNVTPDSFSENGVNFLPSEAIDAGKRMLDEGADLLDIGGESTRPGAAPVEQEEEIRRILPVIKALASVGAVISVDTRKSAVASAALDAGAVIVNDVSSFQDREMLSVCVNAKCTVCLMHMQGVPETMQANPSYDNVVHDVLEYLLDRAQLAKEFRLHPSQIWIDPGIGFGKTPMHNLVLLNHLADFVKTGYPVLIGVSRKSSIGTFAGGVPVDQRLPGTLAAQVLAQAAGVRIIRAHDVKEARQAIDVAAAIIKPSSFSKRLA
jgi:dihydropteroate synthase